MFTQRDGSSAKHEEDKIHFYLASTRPGNRFGHAGVYGIDVSILLYELCAMAAHCAGQ
jgi:hypothetical protein